MTSNSLTKDFEHRDVLKLLSKCFSKNEIQQCLNIHNHSKDSFEYTKEASLDGIEVYLQKGQKIHSFPKLLNKGAYTGNKVFISGNYNQQLTISFFSNNNTALISGNTKWCRLTGKIDLRNSSKLILGKGISSNDVDINISESGLLFGDDGMIGSRVEIRTHSGHSYIRPSSGEKFSYSRRLIIGSHVWLGTNSKIFMCPKIGSCSVIAYGAMITNEVPHLSTAKGFPAKIVEDKDKLWLRNNNERNLSLALKAYNNIDN